MMKYDSVPSPCFILELEKLEKNLRLIQKISQGSGAEINLSFKGFALWDVLDLIRKYVSTASVGSLHEVLLCEEYMSRKSHTYAVAFDSSEIHDILDRSNHITFNSLNQFGQFKDHAIKKGVSIGLRVNPEWSDVETVLYNPASPTSRLGMTGEHLKNGLPQGIEGLHFHVLCESDSFALEKVLEAFVTKFGHLLDRIKWVNMGGGHLMTSDNYDIDHLIHLLRKFKSKYDVDVILEPGSAFAWQTGVLVTSVLDIVENNSVKTAIIDASFTCHMPDCLEMPYRPAISGARLDSSDSNFQFQIGGISCLAGDFLETYGFDREVKIGDKLIFEDMMHYTMVKTTTFNGVKHPSIGKVHIDGSFELIKKFGYEDYKNKLS